MSGMEYGTDEHLDGLSRDALKSEVRWWHGRALEMEAENAKLRELVLALYMCSEFLCGRCKHERGNTCDFDAENELRELGVEVDG